MTVELGTLIQPVPEQSFYTFVDARKYGKIFRPAAGASHPLNEESRTSALIKFNAMLRNGFEAAAHVHFLADIFYVGSDGCRADI